VIGFRDRGFGLGGTDRRIRHRDRVADLAKEEGQSRYDAHHGDQPKNRSNAPALATGALSDSGSSYLHAADSSTGVD
jgi:hypothetical protein